MNSKWELKRVVSFEAGISPRYLNYLLNAERNASPAVATRLQLVTDIHKSVWVFGSAEDRQKYFDDLTKRHGL